MLTLNHFGSLEPSFVADVPNQTTPRFSFVNIQRPEELRDRTKQSLVRRHAKRDADRVKSSRRRAQIMTSSTEPGFEQAAPKIPDTEQAENLFHDRRTEEVDDIRNPTGRPPVRSYDERLGPTENMSYSLDILKPLGAGRGLTPFASYPVKPTARATQLIDFMLHFERLHSRPVRLLWVSLAMADRDSFSITLAHASNLIAQARDQGYAETRESLKYYTSAVQAVSKRLQISTDSTSDGVIGTILGFACLDITYRNWQRWNAHMNGVQKIVQLRGGAGLLQTSYELQMIAFWNDVSGSLVLDAAPHFPIPSFASERYQSQYSVRLQYFIRTWTSKNSELSDISECLEALAGLAEHVELLGISSEQWQQELFIALKVYPVAYRILCMPRFTIEADICTNSSETLIRETLRLAALVFVGFFKEHCKISPSGVTENQLRLGGLLNEGRADWSSIMELRLWVLTIYALATKGDRRLIVTEIASVMNAVGAFAWTDAMNVLRELIWASTVLNDAAAVLGNEVENLINRAIEAQWYSSDLKSRIV